MFANHELFSTAPPPELSGTAIRARMRAVWVSPLFRSTPFPATVLAAWMATRGIIPLYDNPDYPLVLAHDYGCEVTA